MFLPDKFQQLVKCFSQPWPLSQLLPPGPLPPPPLPATAATFATIVGIRVAASAASHFRSAAAGTGSCHCCRCCYGSAMASFPTRFPLSFRCFWVCVTSSGHTEDRDRWASCCRTRGSAELGCSSTDSETERLLENGSLSQGQQTYFPMKVLGHSGSLGFGSVWVLGFICISCPLPTSWPLCSVTNHLLWLLLCLPCHDKLYPSLDCKIR